MMRVSVVAVDERNTLLRGPIRGFLKANGIPAMHSNSHHGWFLRSERLADVVARLEHAGYVVKRAEK